MLDKDRIKINSIFFVDGKRFFFQANRVDGIFGGFKFYLLNDFNDIVKYYKPTEKELCNLNEQAHYSILECFRE